MSSAHQTFASAAVRAALRRLGRLTPTSPATKDRAADTAIAAANPALNPDADPKLPWVRVGVVRSTDVWRNTFHDDALDCPSVVQSSFNRDYELVYRSNYGKLRHVYFDQTSGLWNDATLLGPPNPVGMPGFVQSNRGTPGDFEVVVVDQEGRAEHWTKHNGAPWTNPPGTWYRRQTFGFGFAHGGPSLVQSRLGVTGSPENGTGELHYVGATATGELHHYRFAGGVWTFVDVFGQGVGSGPCLIEGTYGMGDESGTGNFELCVTVNGAIEHWWRHNASGSAWFRSAVFGSDIRRVVALLQGTYGANLEVIAERRDGSYQHFFRDGAGWHAGVVIT